MRHRQCAARQSRIIPELPRNGRRANGFVPWGGDTPQDLVRRLNICAVDVVLGYFTAYELERLDKYARGELHISDEELKRIDADVVDRVGGHEELIGKMKQKCPDVVEDAEAYKTAHS